MRQGRRRQTSSPTSASASLISPKRSTAAPNSQCTISALGSTVLLEVGQQGPRDGEREEQPDRDHEQRRLDHEPPEPLAAWVQKRDPLRLRERPEDSGERGRRAEQCDESCADALL